MSNNIEYEVKILDIDTNVIRDKILELGGKKVGNYHFKRYVFDTIPVQESTWVRLRSDGQKTTLAVKEIASDTVDGTSEWETEVSDMDSTLTILEKIGITPRGYQENLREEYILDDVNLSIDTWPELRPYLEVEAVDADTVFRTLKLLGFNQDDAVTVNTETLYKRIGINLKTKSKLSFEDAV